MIHTEEALAIINAHKSPILTEYIPIEQSIGRILAEDLIADRDFPPFDRVTMDGIALSFQALQSGYFSFMVQGIHLAGEPVVRLNNPTHCIEVMTGAILPKNTDVIVRYEDIEFSEENNSRIANIKVPPLHSYQNIHRQASDCSAEALLVSKGTKIGSIIVGIAASIGKNIVLVEKMPVIALIATGNELVPLNILPDIHQIRISNVFMLQGLLHKYGYKSEIFHLPDNEQILIQKLQEVLENFDILMLSGGVSEGKADFLPKVLKHLGVVKHFHKIAQRPGKPFWFGTATSQKPVFAFPGNPVSTLVCFLKYFLAFQPTSIALKESITFEPNITYFLPVILEKTGCEIVAIPLKSNGSGDFISLTACDGFLELPATKKHFNAGECYPFIEL